MVMMRDVLEFSVFSRFKNGRDLINFAGTDIASVGFAGPRIETSEEISSPLWVDHIYINEKMVDADGQCSLEIYKGDYAKIECRALTKDGRKLSVDFRSNQQWHSVFGALKLPNKHNRPQPAATPTPPTLQEDTHQRVSLGTAFFITPQYLLSNNHVVAECHGPIQVRYPDRPWFLATIAGRDERNDLALLRTEMKNLSSASFRYRPRLGESVAAYGFPYPGMLSASGNFTMGNITSLSGMGDDTRFLQMSAPVQPGNSGGPLLDMSGNVIGVVESQLNAVAVMQAEKTVPQNVNFSIQVPIVVNFLSVKGVSPKIDTSDVPSNLTPSDVADLAKQFTVQLYCEEVAPKQTGKSYPTLQ